MQVWCAELLMSALCCSDLAAWAQTAVRVVQTRFPKAITRIPLSKCPCASLGNFSLFAGVLQYLGSQVYKGT